MSERVALLLAAVLGLSTSGVARSSGSGRESPVSTVRQDVRVAEPSARFRKFGQRNGLFTIEHPDNWRAYGAEDGCGVSIAPDGGVVDTGNGRPTMLYGVIVGRYAPFQDGKLWRVSLEAATDDLVRQILTSNPYLRVQDAQPRPELLDGAASLSLSLAGRSPVTGQEERVTVVTRSLADGRALYALYVVPGSGYDSMAGTFKHMLQTLRLEGANA